MAWDARWGLKLPRSNPCPQAALWLNGLGCPLGIETVSCSHAPRILQQGLNGLGCPLGIETAWMAEPAPHPYRRLMAWDARWGLKLPARSSNLQHNHSGLNGLGCPLGIET